MAERYFSQLLAAMDRLWFHQIILSSEPTSVLSSRTALQSGTSSSSESSTWEGDILSTNCSTSSIFQNDFNNEDEDNGHDNRVGRKRLSRSNLTCNKNRSQSSSPSIQRQRKNLSISTNKVHKLQKFLSCSTLHDLELEELKGFMDLGFQFDEDQLSPRTMSVIPALQRVGEHVVSIKYGTSTVDNIESKIEEKNMGIQPYLSQAWMVKRPDSPLLRLRMARVSRAEEMKECLKVWARTVASSTLSDK